MISPVSPLRILIVEDNRGDFELVQDYLNEYSVPSVIHAGTFKQASSILSEPEAAFDVILLDLTLPDKSGLDLITGILNISKDFPVIILSGYSDVNFSIQAINLGICDYLLKDELNSINLHKSISYCLERQKKTQEIQESEKRFNDLFNFSPQPMWVFDPESLEFIQVNKACLALYGYSEKEFLNITLRDLKVETDKAFLAKHFEDFAKLDDDFKGTFKHHKKSGEVIDVEVYSTLITIDHKRYRSSIVIDITEQIASRIKVEKSERFFKGLIENSQDMIAMLDHTGKTIYVSPSVIKKFGYTNEECLNFGLAGTVHPDDVTIVQDFMTKVMMNPEVPLPCPVTRDRKKDGSYVWVESIFTNFLETEGIEAIVVNFRDITERKIAEIEHATTLAELEDERTRFVTAQAVAKIGSWETDLRTFNLKWSDETHRIFETDPETFEVNYQAFLNFIPPGDREKVDAALQRSLNKGGSNLIEHRIVTTSGLEKCVSETWVIFNDEDNVPIRAVGTCQDITEKKKLEDLLDKTNKLARIGNYEVNKKEGTIYWSDVTREIHEVDKDFVLDSSKSIGFYKEGSSREQITRAVKDLSENNIPYDLELQIITAKGNERWVRNIGQAEFADGKLVKRYGSFQDIDARKKAEFEVLKAYEERLQITADLIQRNHDLEQFSYIISHNLRAPVANIVGLTGELSDDLHDAETKAVLAEALISNANRLENVIVDLNTILQTKRENNERK
ncbi:PAS domain S-box protein [Daejeonella sp.]|uniref:PAS domain S-box protein n=1 Tax=Daejeonella sp. TaxID=2805397 RepID=UPI0030BCFCDB